MYREMLTYINRARAHANLAPLVLSKKLSAGAYCKSKDMVKNKYYDHYSPKYGSPFSMMKQRGILYYQAAENIAINHSIKLAHRAFMRSPGHRANILNPGYSKLGLGFYIKGSDIYITQWFTD